jgi:phospholipid/cholesterol/gamma-HCH transport system substrate-binding protein
MSTRAQQVRLGMFLVGFVVLLFGGLVFIAGSQFWETRDDYEIHFNESVAGLDIGSPLKVNGVSVGRVDGVSLDPEDIQTVVVKVSITGGVRLRRDATAAIQLAGITGLKFIEVNPGTRGQPLLEPGSVIQAGSSDFSVLTGRADDIARQIQVIMARLIRVTSEENLAHVDGILEEMHRTMARVAMLLRTVSDVVGENRADISRVVKNAGTAADSLTKTSDEIANTVRVARDDIHGALNAGERAMNRIDVLAVEGTKAVKSAGGIIDDARDSLTRERISEVMDALSSALEAMARVAQTLQRTVEQGQTDLSATLEAIRTASEQLESFSRTIRDNPGALLRSGGLPEEQVPR